MVGHEFKSPTLKMLLYICAQFLMQELFLCNYVTEIKKHSQQQRWVPQRAGQSTFQYALAFCFISFLTCSKFQNFCTNDFTKPQPSLPWLPHKIYSKKSQQEILLPKSPTWTRAQRGRGTCHALEEGLIPFNRRIVQASQSKHK